MSEKEERKHFLKRSISLTSRPFQSNLQQGGVAFPKKVIVELISLCKREGMYKAR